MKAPLQNETKARPAGYQELIGRYNQEIIPNWHSSYVAATNTHKIETENGITEEVYPSSYWPGESLGSHLEFALKYDGTIFAILSVLFKKIPEEEFIAFIKSKPTGKYARRLWYLYEYLTGSVLPIDDVKKGNYIQLIEPEKYYTATPPRQIRRQRIHDNLLGNSSFCPMVRRTETLFNFEKKNLTEKCREVVSEYPEELLKRALSYLYTKETKSSFEIENIQPDASRTERFVSLLQLAETKDFCEKSHLIDLQNRLVDERFQESDYRKRQNYVGETVSYGREKVHFVCPKPEDLVNLMEGLIAAHFRLEDSETHRVVQASAIAYGFVFLHPFEDGNGRIHRFLIHNILARGGFTPEGIMFPVSAAMLNNMNEYDASLEAFSKPLLPLVDFSLDDIGEMSIHNETAHWYAFIDMTHQTEALFHFIEQTINTELVEELAFLANYDDAKKAVRDVVDMPDRKIDLFIRFTLQNSGKLSSQKHASHFEFLTDEEVKQMERAIQSIYVKCT